MTKIIFLLCVWVMECGLWMHPVGAWPWDDKAKVRRSSYNELLDKNLRLQEKIKQLQAEADKMASMNQALLGHTKEVSKDNEDLKAAVETLKNRLVERKLASDKLRASKEALAQELNEAQERLIKLEKARRGKFDYARKKIEQSLKRQYERRAKKLRGDLRKEKAAFQRQLEFYQKQVKDIEKRLKAQEDRHKARLDKLSGGYETKLEKMRGEYEAKLESQAREYNDETEGIRREYEAKISDLQKGFDDELGRREKEYNRLREEADSGYLAEIARLEKDRSVGQKALREKIDNMESDFARESKRLADARKKAQGLLDKEREISRGLRQQNKALLGQVADLNLAVKKLTLENGRLDKELSDSNVAAQKRERDLEAEVAELNAQIKELREKAGRFRSDWITTRKQRDKLLRENKAYSSSNLALRKKNKQAALKIGALRSEKRRLEGKVSNLRHNLQTNERIKEKAEEEYVRLKDKMDRERVDMHYNMALMFEREGLYKDAEREYLKVLAINALDAGTHYNLGILYDDYLRDIPKAIYHYKQYLEINPEGQYIYEVKEWIMQAEEKIRIESKVN
ncbi:MAG: hypothetical protein ACE5GG_01795 [Candidatus Omnitrophota bacterium]